MFRRLHGYFVRNTFVSKTRLRFNLKQQQPQVSKIIKIKRIIINERVKELLSKELYCYKFHTLLMKSSAYPPPSLDRKEGHTARLHQAIQFPIYYHSCHGLINAMFDNHSFTVFNLLHNCSLSHYHYFKTVTAVTSQSKSLVHVVGKSYLLGCKLEIKTFKTSHSGRFEVAKIQSLQEAVCVDPMRGLHFSQISRNKTLDNKIRL